MLLGDPRPIPQTPQTYRDTGATDTATQAVLSFGGFPHESTTPDTGRCSSCTS